MTTAVIHLNDDKPSTNDLSHREFETSAAVDSAAAFHHLTTIQTARVFWRATSFCVLVAFAACSDGYQYSLPGNLIANEGFILKFGTLGADGTYAINAQHLAVWGGVYSAGYIVSLLLGGYPSDLFGRRAVIGILTVFLVIAGSLELTATEWVRWCIAKLFLGFATGLVQSSVATYVSEVAPTKIRGALLGVYSVFFAVGQLAAAGATEGIQLSKDPLNYKASLYSNFAFSGFIFAILLWVPESPRFYARKGNAEKTKQILHRLNKGVAGYNLEAEYAMLEQEVRDGQDLAALGKGVSYVTIFKGTNLRRTWISFAPLAWQQLIGIPVVFGYTSYFFQLAGLKNPFDGTVAVYVILLAGILFSFYLVEKVGRRKMFITGGLVMVISLVIIGALNCVPITSGTSNATIAVMCVWVAAYACSAGPLGYIYLGESSTPLLRAKTTGFAAAGTGAFGLIFNYCAPLMLSPKPSGAGWGPKTAFFFAGTGFLSLIVLYFTVPETKARTYLELDELFARKISARHFATTKTSVDAVAEEKEGRVGA